MICEELGFWRMCSYPLLLLLLQIFGARQRGSVREEGVWEKEEEEEEEEGWGEKHDRKRHGESRRRRRKGRERRGAA